MRTNVVFDLSIPFVNYLEQVANQSRPVLAYSTDDILNFIGRIEAEGFKAPAGLTIKQVLIKAINYTNARLPTSLRIVYQLQGVIVTTVAYLDCPICQA